MSEPGTPLPWKADAVHGLMVQSATAKLTVIAKLSPKYDYHPGMQTCQKNAAYIVEACNTYPQLRAENERLRDKNKYLLAANDMVISGAAELRAENERLRAALQFSYDQIALAQEAMQTPDLYVRAVLSNVQEKIAEAMK